MNQDVILTCKRVLYQSQTDEDFFFKWIEMIPSVYKLNGRFDELYLYIKGPDIPQADIKELVALFKRYKIRDSRQLNVFKQ